MKFKEGHVFLRKGSGRHTFHELVILTDPNSNQRFLYNLSVKAVTGTVHILYSEGPVRRLTKEEIKEVIDGIKS